MTVGNVGTGSLKKFKEILAAAAWKELTPSLLYYADNLIRQCVWRGMKVSAKPGAKVCVEGVSADDLLHEAIEKFLDGRRTYNHSVSLEQNLKGSMRSILWNLNKSSRSKPIIDLERETSDQKSAAISRVASSDPSADCSIIANENARYQQRMLKDFEEFIGHEKDLLKILGAYKNGQTKPREIEKTTGIPVKRISELKRKLRSRMEEFQANAARDR